VKLFYLENDDFPFGMKKEMLPVDCCSNTLRSGSVIVSNEFRVTDFPSANENALVFFSPQLELYTVAVNFRIST